MDRIILKRVRSAPSQSTDNESDKKKVIQFTTPLVPRQKTRGTKRPAEVMIAHLQNGSGKFPALAGIKKQRISAIPKTKIDTKEKTEKIDIFSSLQQIKEQNLDLRPQKQTIKANICESFNNHIDFVVSTCESNSTADIDNQMLMTLYKEAAGLNHIGNTNKINIEQLLKLLNLLDANIKIGTQITTPFNRNIQLFRRSIEKVLATADACLVCMYIMTSKNMPKRVYLEELIHRVMNCINHIIANTILPAIDPTYTAENKTKENCQNLFSSEKSFILLTVKITELVYLIAELIDVLTLDETAISLAFSICTATFWAKNVQNLQIASLNLVTKLFKTYKRHQTVFLDNILSSLVLLPTTKQHLKTYILKDGTNISIVSALVLQLIQSIVTLPENLFQKNTKSKTKDKVDISTLICNKYQEATSMAGGFLTIFFQRCFKQQKNTDRRSLFENFVQDLLLVRNNPEFPGTDLMLCLLGKMLVKIFLNKDDQIALRVVSLDCLTIIAAKLRKDNVLFASEKANISDMICKIKRKEQNSSQKDADKSKINVDVLINDEKFLQRLLLEFLGVNSQQNGIYKNARLFYLVQWYKDFATRESQLGLDDKEKSNTKKCNLKYKSSSKAKNKSKDNENVPQTDPEIAGQIAEKEKFLLEKIQDSLSPEFQHQVYEYQIEYNEAKMIVALLASKRYFSQSFDQYFNAILIVLKDASNVLRTKGLKCLTTIIETDPTVLESNDTQLMISQSFIDPSASVREAVVDLLVKFILDKPELINKYYDMLSARILDTGISIRKRVIKILNEICLHYPDFEKNTEICVKIIRRINDEDSVKELVLKMFQTMWFTCASGSKLFKKVTRIVEVVAASQELENFEQLLFELLKPSEEKYNSSKSKVDHPNEILRASRQIVDFLMEPTLRSPNKHNYESPERLAAILKTLHIFAKVRPQLLVRHVTKLQSYLELQEESPKDNGTIGSVIAMLELAIPLSENPSDMFLAQLEEQIIKLLLRYDRTIVNSCLSCLGAICNKITHKYDAIRDCFTKFYNYLVGYTNWESTGLSTEEHAICKAVIKRSLFIVGLLLKYFDFKDPEVLGELAPDTTDQVYRTMLCFLQKDSIDIQVNTLKAIGIICSRYYQLLWDNQLKTIYYEQLASKEASLLIKVEILNNIENFLKEEDIRLIEDNKNWNKISKKTDLKEMDDVSSGIASIVIQYYLKVVLNCYVHDSLQIRQAVFRVVQMILRQGLVHPILMVPYLICMSTDCEQPVALNADKRLYEIENRYPGLIHTRSTLGIQLSFQLQKILKQEKVVRGFKIKEKEEYPVALNGHLYSLLRGSRQQRRALILFSLKQFEEPNELALSYMIYLADNMAYFPYQVQDEPLFLVHYIDIKILLFGTNLLQNFKNGLNSVKNQTKKKNPDDRTDDITGVDIDEDEEDETTVLSRLPKDTSQLQACMSAAQGWLLLLDLKQYIVDVYGLSHEDNQLYSPSAAAKVYEKPVQRKSNIMFNPKSTLEKLKEICLGKQLKAKNKTTLVREYIDFSRLVNSI
ncbi:nipped-B-like protein [Diabrotica undecimpunctata]|uniref:nipped-B-like protein n=1 Tax=Diabrotica undecimpunctata TaxID=50387 RepID=UPI003B6332B6